MSVEIEPYSLRNAPSLIECVFPVQKLSAEAYKEQMAGSGKLLTALGGYWKGRKPLVLNRACVLASLLPATEDLARDLEVFEMLMGLDQASLAKRRKRTIRASLAQGDEIPAHDQLPRISYRDLLSQLWRFDEAGESVIGHVWKEVNAHLGTSASTIHEVIEQLGVMRFGRTPRVGDTFSGSGQIPFAAAQLGCDVYASDLNPIAAMLTWGALNIVGGSSDSREQYRARRLALIQEVEDELRDLDVEPMVEGWRPKVFLYCLEARCPQTGWRVPLLPSLVISQGYKVIAELVPDRANSRYDIVVRSNVDQESMFRSEIGTVRTEGAGNEPYLVHELDGQIFSTRISTLRGDHLRSNARTGNGLRPWRARDVAPEADDVFQERLYCVQWSHPRGDSSKEEFAFRSVTKADDLREQRIRQLVQDNIADWQQRGWVPDQVIEQGVKTDEPIRTRGWHYWHQLWPPRQLLVLALIKKRLQDPAATVAFASTLDFSSKLGRWTTSGIRVSKDEAKKQVGGASNSTANVFYNQALNTLYNYGIRSGNELLRTMNREVKSYPIRSDARVGSHAAHELRADCDIFVTDPPYGDAVKYEEILEFFIAWLRKNPPPEFADWVWDSRRALAIKGEDEDFRRGMVAAYKRMTECMPDNGIQVIMFTHQSGKIWADMANIVWASGLHVTAAWYVVTETDSALREGSYVKGTVLLVLRKRQGTLKATRDDLAWEIQEEVEAQVASLTGLNQQAKGLYRDENVFEDADIQMAGYAAALRVLTKYATIDGRDMTVEAIRPRVKGEKTFVDGLIEFAVDTANQCLVPQGIAKELWDKLSGAERFYLKMVDLEARGAKTLDNYQNFAKAFKVRDFKPLMARHKANDARLKSATEFGRSEMGEGSELYQSVLRATLYALMELEQGKESDEVLAHLALNVGNYYGDMTQRARVVELADYLAQRLSGVRAEEASAARVLREAVRNQRLG